MTRMTIITCLGRNHIFLLFLLQLNIYARFTRGENIATALATDIKIARPKLLFSQAPYKLESTRLPFLYVMHVPVTKCNVNCKVLRHGKSYHIVPKVVWNGEHSSVPENPFSVQELIPDIFYDMTIVKRQEPCWIERVPGKDQSILLAQSVKILTGHIYFNTLLVDRCMRC